LELEIRNLELSPHIDNKWSIHQNKKMRENWQNVGNEEIKLEKKIKNIRYIISAFCAITGIIILTSQLLPLSVSFIKGKYYEWKENALAAPVPQEYKDEHMKEFGYDPGQSYFKNLLANAGINYSETTTYDPETKQMVAINIDQDYSTPMQITIESVGIYSIKLQPNVQSQDEKVYNQALKVGVAHFKGTPLPGDGGNSFIYGHSSVSSFFNINPNNPEVIFSRLENAETGQKVIIKRDDKELTYTIRTKKIVDPNDLSILQPQNYKETVTLMTCWPLGIGSKRLILIAERSE
jgi:LPXTG-site transpeptidase (sortase) family protein